MALIAGPHRAAAQSPQWITLDGSPPGTAAEVRLDQQSSTPQRTVFDIVIHGLSLTPRTGPDGTVYQLVDVPGLQHLSIPGAPMVPELRAPLALVTGVSAPSFAGMTARSDTRTFHVHLWPQPIPALDDEAGTPEIFERDSVLYASLAPYPSAPAATGATTIMFGSIPGALVECRPIQWVPANDLLRVTPITRYPSSRFKTSAKSATSIYSDAVL